MNGKRKLYRVVFHSRGKIYEVYARSVAQSGLYGFVEVGDLVFGERSNVVVDPAEERLKAEFDGVSRFYVPMHAVIRIDEVEKEGVAKITEPGEGGKVTPFPLPFMAPGRGEPGGS
ncbi:MAG TPA: DUF1820 family protein [Chromatiales bacterium]|nr:DUF1820 family protein [Chromatiales bacterium]